MNQNGKTLADLRRGSGYTQKTAADALKLNPNTVAAWECGRRSPSKRNIRRLLDLYAATSEQRVEVSTALLGAA